MKLPILLACLMSIATVASSQEQANMDTVGGALGVCRSAASTPGKIASMGEAYCIGVVAGTSQTMLTACTSVRNEGAEIPSTMTMARPKGNFPSYAATQAFVNWAEANPDRWDMPFTLAIIVALAEAFPCED